MLIRRTDDNYPIPWRDFALHAAGSRKLKIPEIKAAFEALGSGYFEGVVHAENIELAAERTCFVSGPALNMLYVAIFAWYDKVGRELFESEHEARRDKRYQSYGEMSLERLRSVLEGSTVFAALTRRLQSVLPEGDPVRSTRRTDGRPRPHDPRQRATTEPKPERKRVIAEPPIPRERDSRDQTRGITLRYAYEMLPQSNRLWEFGSDGILTFNIRHPIWVKLDETNGKHTPRNARQLMHLQEWLTLKLLMLLEHHNDAGFDLDVARVPVDREVRYYAEMFIAHIK